MPSLLTLLTYCNHVVPSVLWHCWLGGRKGIRPVKNWVVGCWHGYLSAAMCRIAYGPADATATHCLLLQQIQIGFTFLVPAHLGSPRKGPLNGCVCVTVVTWHQAACSRPVSAPVWQSSQQSRSRRGRGSCTGEYKHAMQTCSMHGQPSDPDRQQSTTVRCWAVRLTSPAGRMTDHESIQMLHSPHWTTAGSSWTGRGKLKGRQNLRPCRGGRDDWTVTNNCRPTAA